VVILDEVITVLLEVEGHENAKRHTAGQQSKEKAYLIYI